MNISKLIALSVARECARGKQPPDLRKLCPGANQCRLAPHAWRPGTPACLGYVTPDTHR